MKKLISIVVPVFNEEKNIMPLYNELVKLAGDLSDRYDFEFIFTDNHSSDNTFDEIKKIAENDKRIKALKFSKNFGFQRSIYTGYVASSGDATVQIDCDLQDPPDLIKDFIDEWEKGSQVVYGIRKKRKENLFMNLARKIFYRFINFLSEDKLPLDAGDFRLVDKKIIKELEKNIDYQPYLRGSIASMGFKQKGIEYERRKREIGKSKFSFKDLLDLSLDGILNHSVVPLRIATYTGLTVSVITFISMLVYIAGKIFLGKEWPAGFATTTILILLSLSLNALFLGIIGEYLGRIYKQVKKTSITIVEERLNIE